jgi:1-deoxy-D-xylulose-5-phosphate reductoisomerase
VLGSTGSIGTQVLEVVRALNTADREEFPRFDVVALAAGRNLSRLAKQIREFRPRWVSIQSPEDAEGLREALGPSADTVEILIGEEVLKGLITRSGADLVVNGLVGAAGLVPTLTALETGIDVALANKESLVIGGHLVRRALSKANVKLLPIDSEHSAIYQLLEHRSASEVKRIVLTASGGALRDLPLEDLESVAREEVLQHPTWAMGPRITVDSATLVNKAFEVIEAHWLFDLEYERIEALLHPQSVLHGLVELRDGSVLAHLSAPDMCLPIQYALTHPHRAAQCYRPLPLRNLRLELREIDRTRYPAFEVVIEAGRKGASYPAVANAADEVAVERFLKGEIGFLDIPRAIYDALRAHQPLSDPTLEEVLAADRWAREYVQNWAPGER